ncbi:hypothetical protein [Fulvivirga ligni]|uniref:hypothetical protein n=1 Tax=Fulvivirga ligni TaxID=2904246 RepID=UPI001F3259E1|nr:hypothetical protein [Fulvivirga ligni]UII21192.1 hypothetical protein LVD16_25485 [Fulvivirga ligni]
MKDKDLPDRWRAKVNEYLKAQGVTDRNKLSASDFQINKTAKIKFEDDSYAEFRYPLIINAPELDEVGVFTEHCGYHIFSLGGTDIDLVDNEDL